jgi:hypothetical protein
VARAKRNRSYRLSKIHDRRSHDLPHNAQVAEVEVDDPMALEPGEKIVALRSIRNDPLGRLHSHRQIDKAQYLGGPAFQNDWEKAERGPQAVDPGREYADGVGIREPVTEAQRNAVQRLNRAEREIGADGAVGARRAHQGHDNGAGRPAARSAQPALARLFLAAPSRMPRPSRADLWICDREKRYEPAMIGSKMPASSHRSKSRTGWR